MNIDLNLTPTGYIHHHELVTAPVDTVTLDIKSYIYSTEGVILTVIKGDVKRQHRFVGEPIDITDLCQTAGVINITAQIGYAGESLKVWQVEPLLVKELDGGLVITPEMEEIKKRLFTLEKAVIEIIETKI